MDAAIADAERASDLEGNSASSKRRLSNALRLRGAIASDDNNKLSYFDRAITLDATNHAAFYARAAVHTERKDFSAAIRDLEKAIGLEGGEELYKTSLVGVYDQRAIGLALKRDLDSALNAYSAAIRLDQTSNSLKVRRAHVLVLKREFRAAIADLTAIIKAEPNNVEALLLRGSGLEAIGKSDEAATDYAAILKFEPTQAEARASYERLKGVAEPTSVTINDESLITRLQRELERVGCDPGEIDGIWGDDSKGAVSEFAKHAKVAVSVEAPSPELLAALGRYDGRVCPLECDDGEVAMHGKCVGASKVPGSVKLGNWFTFNDACANKGVPRPAVEVQPKHGKIVFSTGRALLRQVHQSKYQYCVGKHIEGAIAHYIPASGSSGAQQDRAVIRVNFWAAKEPYSIRYTYGIGPGGDVTQQAGPMVYR